MPLCPSGTEPKPGTAELIIISGVAATALLTKRMPALGPFMGAMESLILDTGILCNGDPVEWPTFTPTDFTDLVRGIVSDNVIQAVHHAAWYGFCQCTGAPTPAPPPIESIDGIPQNAPATVLPCQTLHFDFAPEFTGETGPYDLFGSALAPRGIPAGATSVRSIGIGVETAVTAHEVRKYDFEARFLNATGGTVLAKGPSAQYYSGEWHNEDFTSQIPATAVSWYVIIVNRTGSGGVWVEGDAVTADYEFYCKPSSALEVECCPPDPAVIAMINRLQASVNQVLDALAPPGALVEIASQAIVAEGTLQLRPGTRQVNVQLELLGGGTRLVPYAHPDRVMRAGTIRFGNDFGWRRREHVDNTDCLFPVPPDATVISWSLSPGTSGTLRELGAVDSRALL
jgi:hypothetical protein